MAYITGANHPIILRKDMECLRVFLDFRQNLLFDPLLYLQPDLPLHVLRFNPRQADDLTRLRYALKADDLGIIL